MFTELTGIQSWSSRSGSINSRGISNDNRVPLPNLSSPTIEHHPRDHTSVPKGDVHSAQSQRSGSAEDDVIVAEQRADASHSPSLIERLPIELLEQVISTLISLGNGEYLQSRTAIKSCALVSRRWSVVACRLALVHVQITSRLLADRVIEYAGRMSMEQGGWAPTQVLRVRHAREGDIYRLSELIELFGRTLYTLDITVTGWKSPAVGVNLPGTVEKEILFPNLRTLRIYGLSSITVQECVRNCDPTKLEKVALWAPTAGGPLGGYLGGMRFSRLEDLILGIQPFGRKGTLEDLRTSTPGLKTLRLGVSDVTLKETVYHMERTWPKSVRHLEVAVWDTSEIISIDDPLILNLATVAEENKVEFFKVNLRRGMVLRSYVLLKPEPTTNTTTR